MKKNYENPVVEIIDIKEDEIQTAGASNILYWWGEDPNNLLDL